MRGNRRTQTFYSRRAGVAGIVLCKIQSKWRETMVVLGEAATFSVFISVVALLVCLSLYVPVYIVCIYSMFIYVV